MLASCRASWSALPLSAALLAGCVAPREVASPAPPPAVSGAVPNVVVPLEEPPARSAAGVSRYRCDHDMAFVVSFADDAATIDAGARGRQVLQRDAGGVRPQEVVYSSTELKAEFGIGDDGREAVLHYAEPAIEAHCRREP